MTAHPAAVRVVCVTYRPGPELDDFAASLTGSAADLELVIVDNGDDHAIPRQVAERHAGVLRVPGSNLGYGAAANLGAAGAAQPWLVVANPDIVWHAGALEALLDAGNRHPEAGALGPALLNLDGSRYPSARALPSLRQGIGHALLARVWPTNPWTRAYQGATADDDERAVGWLSGACLLLRREAFEQVGGFDDGYFMFFEDMDLGARLGRAGWSSVHVPSAQVTHVGGTSWRDRPAAMIREHHRSAVRFLSRRYPRWYHWPLRTALRAGLAARQVIELRRAR